MVLLLPISRGWRHFVISIPGLEDGVLTLTLTKATEAQRRQIPIT
jgi:hypothetical protein